MEAKSTKRGACTSLRIFPADSCNCHCTNANNTCSIGIEPGVATGSHCHFEIETPATCIIRTWESSTLDSRKQKQNANQTANAVAFSSCFFFFKIRLLSGGDSRPPRGQRTTSWHFQAKLKFWATQSIKPPTRGGETASKMCCRQKLKWIFLIWFWSSGGVTWIIWPVPVLFPPLLDCSVIALVPTAVHFNSTILFSY